MTRRSHGLGIAAAAVALALTFASAELSSALAQDTDPEAAVAIDVAADAEPASSPVFVAQEVVQPVAEPSEEVSSATRATSLQELVSETETDFTLSEQMHCLAGTVYFEARGEPLSDQLAMAQVVINRADSSRFPSSY